MTNSHSSPDIVEMLERADEYLGTIANKGNCGPHHLVSDLACALRASQPATPTGNERGCCSRCKNPDDCLQGCRSSAVIGEPVAWRVLCTNNGATGYLYTEQVPFDPGPGVTVRRQPEPLYADVAQPPAEPSPLTWLAEHKNYELSFNGWDEDPAWQVHSVNGGRNDREWTLRATGSTPEEALRKAMAITSTHGAPSDRQFNADLADDAAMSSTDQAGGK